MSRASPTILPAAAALTLMTAALAGCAVRYDDQHADAPTRMRAVAARFQDDFHTGGMAGVTADTEACYQRATALNLIKRYELQDCLALDYAGYKTDVIVGRGVLKGPALPYYEDQIYFARIDKYGHLAGFETPQQMGAFLAASYALVSQDMAQMNAAPMIINHPPTAPRVSHFPF